MEGVNLKLVQLLLGIKSHTFSCTGSLVHLTSTARGNVGWSQLRQAMLSPWKGKQGKVCTAVFVQTILVSYITVCRSKQYSQSRPMPDMWLASDPRVTSSHLTPSKSAELQEL